MNKAILHGKTISTATEEIPVMLTQKVSIGSLQVAMLYNERQMDKMTDNIRRMGMNCDVTFDTIGFH